VVEQLVRDRSGSDGDMLAQTDGVASHRGTVDYCNRIRLWLEVGDRAAVGVREDPERGAALTPATPDTSTRVSRKGQHRHSDSDYTRAPSGHRAAFAQRGSAHGRVALRATLAETPRRSLAPAELLMGT
jgi:hypothetical protein